MAFIVDQFKVIADWFTPRSKAQEIIKILQQIAEGNFDYKISVSKKDNDEHTQILKGLKLTLGELKKLEVREQRRRRQLLEANRQLRELDRRKREFMELVSHQLKTPLASMELGLDLLTSKSQHWNQEERSILGEVCSSYQRLSKLVRSLLAAERVEEKIGLKPKFKRARVREILEVLISDFKPNFEAKGLGFIVSNPEPSLSMRTDPEFVIDILQNLLENALQYTDQGAVSLSVHPRDSQVDFTVTDTGIGMPVSDQRRAFDKLYRGTQVKNRAEQGSGLGLYYTRQLVKKLKGRISLDSHEGHGTTFYVSLPRN